jgi:hypothetical protein
VPSPWLTGWSSHSIGTRTPSRNPPPIRRCPPAPDRERKRLTPSPRWEENPFNLVLPNGTKLGHRSLQKFYKQKFRPDDPLSVLPLPAPLLSSQPSPLTCPPPFPKVRLNKKMVGDRAYKLMEAELALRKETRHRNGMLVASAMHAKGNSKALP